MKLKPSLLVLLTALSACATTPSPNQPSPPPTAPNTTGIRVIGNQIQVTLSGIGTRQLSATAKQVSDPGVKPLTLSSSSFALTSGNASVIARSSTDIIPLGAIRTSGYRYVSATVSFTNTGTVPLTNLTFTGSAVGTTQTAIAGLERYPGLAPYTTTETGAIARSIRPTSPVTLEPRSLQPALMPGEEDALQIFNEDELPKMLGTLLPYGFVSHMGSSRTIPVGGTGTFTVAMRVSLQALSKDDPYSITVQLTALENSVTTVTESLEAQLPINQAAFNAARARIGGELRVMPGTVQTSGKALCQVRTAGTGGSATDYLINRVPTSVALLTRVITKDQTLPLQVTGTDANGSFNLPAQGVLTDPSLATITGSQITALSAGPTTVTATACGVTSSGAFNVLKAETLSAGSFHNLALKSDGTVSAWGYNDYGQTTVPTGLTNVIAISAGAHYSLALKSDGTVSAWGYNPYGQTTVPTKLSNVVAISGGFYHSLALKSDGTVSAWGYNNSGQLNVPNGLSNVIAISAGGYHSLALKSDGTVSAWGSNASGQLIVPVIAPLTFKLP